MTTTPEQIEAVARAIANDDDWWEDYTLYAERAISAMRPFIRDQALEEFQKQAAEYLEMAALIGCGDGNKRDGCGSQRCPNFITLAAALRQARLDALEGEGTTD